MPWSKFCKADEIFLISGRNIGSRKKNREKTDLLIGCNSIAMSVSKHVRSTQKEKERKEETAQEESTGCLFPSFETKLSGAIWEASALMVEGLAR